MPYEVLEEASAKLGIPIGDLRKRRTWLGPAGKRSMATVDEPQKELVLDPILHAENATGETRQPARHQLQDLRAARSCPVRRDAKGVIKWIPGQFDPRPFCQGYLQPRDERTRQRLAQARGAQPMVPSPSHFKAPPRLQSPPSPAMTHGGSKWDEVRKHGSREKEKT